jgi:hypothetical protein
LGRGYQSDPGRVPAAGCPRPVLAQHRPGCPYVTAVRGRGRGAPAPARRRASPTCPGDRRNARHGRHRRG